MLDVVSIGAATAIGRDCWATCAAERAGVAGFSSHPHFVDSAGTEVRVARAPWLDPRLGVAERCAILVEEALEDALTGVPEVESVDIVLVLPAGRPGLPAGLVETVSDRMPRRGPAVRVVDVVRGGHPGAIGALARCKAVLAGGSGLCAVLGVDSWMDADAIAWLESQDRLHGAGELNHPWGRVPGEAAGAIVVATTASSRRHGARVLAQIESIGLGHEPVPVGHPGVCTGVGLIDAMRGALQVLAQGERADDIVCDMNGERYRADEFAFASLRLRDRLRQASDFFAPADVWGDVGAASAPLAIIRAVVAGQKGYAAGPRALVHASSDGAERGAALIRLPTARGD